jgi:glycosyltransferase involved in cell wall biosynthesis
VKVAILTVQTPFVRGGAEALADSLATRLQGRGHRTEILRVPFKWYPPQAIPEHMLACRLLRVDSGEPDLVIALKFPSYLAPFAHKKIWLLHQFRQVYEKWGSPQSGLADTPKGRCIRDAIIKADNTYLRQTRQLFTISRTVANRLLRFNQIEADEVLFPPLERPDLFRGGEFGGYFFYPSRLNEDKRQALAIEAMRHVRSDFGLVIAGRGDNAAYENGLRGRVEEMGLQHKVKLLGWVSEEEKAGWMNGACGALNLPIDEDFGFVTLEAFHAAKPVITCTDSGGTLELIEDQVNGLVVEPSAQALAAAMEKLWADRRRAIDLGHAGRETLARLHIDWEYVLDRLLQ